MARWKSSMRMRESSGWDGVRLRAPLNLAEMELRKLMPREAYAPSTFLNSREALWPPKPNVLLSAIRTSFFTDAFGT